MKKWVQTNLRNIIVTAFVIPILLVAFVSISHVTTFYGISNPLSWAIYLSVAIEIAALAALAAVSVRMGKFVYLPFFIVTLIQFVGNLYFSFTFIDENTNGFKEWMNMVGSFFEIMGVDPTDPIAHKRILALLSGGLLPIISLTFAHMLVVYSDKIENISKTEKPKELTDEELSEISKIAGKIEAQNVSEPVMPKLEDLEQIEKVLNNLSEKKFGKQQNTESEEMKINIPIPDDLEIESLDSETYIPEDLETNLPQKIEEEKKEEIMVDAKLLETKEETSNEPPTESERQIKRLIYAGRNG